MAVSSASTATTSAVTETIYPVMVNGYLCYSAAEVSAVKSGRTPDSVKPGGGQKTGETSGVQAQAEIQAQAQAKQLAEAQARVAQFSQLPDDQQRQQQEESRRGQLVDFHA